ncbi:uncharacterized protein [Anabrus simplex]|uniref:uncharacterized protein n=1 Tax=Anabrus simplex TaxID=316456 RepID=UPI0034DDC88A
MNALKCIGSIVKWQSSVTKSVYMLNSTNLSSISAYPACISKVKLLPPYSVPLQIKSRTTVTSTSRSTEDKLKVKDGIPTDYELIYRAPMNSYVIAAQGFSSVLSSLFIALGAFEYIHGESGDRHVIINDVSIIQTNEQILMLIAVFVIANVSLQIFALKYPIRIYKNKMNSFIAVYVGYIPFKTRQVEFKAGNVIRLPPSGVMPWGMCWFKIKDKNSILLEHYFRKPADLHSMLQEK